MVELFANNAQSTLTAAIVTTPAAGTVETWAVASTALPFSQTGNFRLTVGDSTDLTPEIVLVTAVVDPTHFTVQRGAESSTIKVHANGDAVTQTLTAGSYDQGIQDRIAGKAPLASPTFTGVPAAPTAAPGTNTTQLATAAFVAAAIAAAQAAAFTPLSLPGLRGWFKGDGTIWQDSARTTLATADNDPVGAWDDVSGNSKHALQTTAGIRPLLKLNALNGKNGVRFGNVPGAYLTATLAVTAQPVTICGVFRSEGGPSQLGAIAYLADGAVGAATRGYLNIAPNTGNLVMSDGAVDLVSTGMPDTIGFSTYVGVLNGPSSYTRVNRVQTVAGSVGANAYAGICFGSRNNGTSGSNVIWCEWFAFTGVPSATDLVNIETYLTNRWLAPGNGTAYVQYGGPPIASLWTTANTMTGAAVTGTTFLDDAPYDRVRSRGNTIRRVRLNVQTDGAGFKLKVFRPNGANFDFVAESEVFTPGGTAVRTRDLTTPIVCQPLDVLGLFVPAGAGIYATTRAAQNSHSAAGDITTTNAFTTAISSQVPDIEVMGAQPFLCPTGDSISAGHNGTVQFFSIDDASGMVGDITNEFWYNLANASSRYSYINHAAGTQTFAWVLSTGMPRAVADASTAIHIHCGVNDVATGRTWAQVLSDLDAIKLKLKTGQHLFIDEILPYPGGTDAMGATIRTFNTNLATWCTANGATLIVCHDAMGQIRVSTGFLDDLLTAYSRGDGVHLSAAGVTAMVTILRSALDAYYGP